MPNIIENNYNKIDLRVSSSDYWDFTLSKENDPYYVYDGSELYSDAIISYIDISNPNCISGNTKLYSLPEYKWDVSINLGLELNDIGFTGIDNGLISDITVSGITGSTLEITTGDTRLLLNKISGYTGDYIYPSEIIDDHISLNGGFYQGFFKSGDDYAVLPDNINSEITFELALSPSNNPDLSNTLNYKYPDNKGFFLYLGTRSENKFWYEYYKTDESNYEISKTGETSPIPSGITLHTSDGYEINTQNITEIKTDNKYLLFNRTTSGYTANTFDPTLEYHITYKEENNVNLYLEFNRTHTGYTAVNIDNVPNIKKEYNVIDDVISNSIGFRLKEDSSTGNTYSIGYRTIIEKCVSGDTGYTTDVVMDEEYSSSGLTVTGLTYVDIRAIFNVESSCSNNDRLFKLYFYINGKLVFVSKELPELFIRNLNDTYEKQEGVPYNISIGGGSQGLCDMIGFDTNYSTQYLFPIEKYFAGTFIGDIYKFVIYYGKMDYTKIKNNYLYNIK
jgi:hypothetical protein